MYSTSKSGEECIRVGRKGEEKRQGGRGREIYLRVLLGPLETLGLEPDLICFLKADILSCVLENFLLPEKKNKQQKKHVPACLN